MDLKLIVQRNRTFGICPKCKQEMTLERAKTNNKFERTMLMIIRFKKYHCKACKWYGSLFIYTISRNIKKVLLNYLIIIAIIAVISILINTLLKKVYVP
jgi:hypothetical protein